MNTSNKTMRAVASIDMDAVFHNLEAMHANIHEQTKIAAVIKANAYGHGASAIAEKIEHLPYLWGFAVACMEEAMELRRTGRTKPILILGIVFPEYFEDVVKWDIRPAVCDYQMAKELSDIAVSMQKEVNIHIKLDTGMSRIGFQINEESANQIAAIAKLPNLVLEGIFTHFASADEQDKEPVYEQMELFLNMIHKLEERQVSIPIKHCSNSAGIAEIPDANFDMVRAGITLYGLWPSEQVNRESMDLQPVMSLKSHISFLKELEPGRKVSYGGTYITEKKQRIATVPVGYADGYSRGLSNKGYVLIHGKKAPICGRVCMDQFMVDVTDIPEVRVGDTVTLLGKNHGEQITMEQLGEWSGRFNYEFACLIAPRIPRVYTKMQKE